MDDIRFCLSLPALRPAPRERRVPAGGAGRGRRTAAVVLAALAAVGTAGAPAHASGGTSSHRAAHGGGSTTKQVQRALGLAPDGIAGPRTRAAIKRFQRRHGLVADGIAGPRTLAALGIRGRPAPRSARTRPSALLRRIAECESGGDPRAVSADGRYRGKYQFSRATWRAMGGTGDPAAAPEAEQDRRAARLLRQRGTAPWPACGTG